MTMEGGVRAIEARFGGSRVPLKYTHRSGFRPLLGVTASTVDGLEVNLLGLNFGVSPNGVKLPLVGIIGGFTPSASPAPAASAAAAAN